MKCRGWPVLLALILPACGDEPAARQQERLAPAAAAPAAPAPSREVAGPELRILAFGDSLFAGYRVGARESYPAQLEAALRGRGHAVEHEADPLPARRPISRSSSSAATTSCAASRPPRRATTSPRSSPSCSGARFRSC